MTSEIKNFNPRIAHFHLNNRIGLSLCYAPMIGSEMYAVGLALSGLEVIPSRKRGAKISLERCESVLEKGPMGSSEYSKASSDLRVLLLGRGKYRVKTFGDVEKIIEYLRWYDINAGDCTRRRKYSAAYAHLNSFLEKEEVVKRVKPMPTKTTVSQALGVLNSALKLDPESMNTLFSTRVPCNSHIADHPTIQVANRDAGGFNTDVGILGIINGLFGVDGSDYGPIAAIVDEDSSRIFGFVKTDDKMGGFNKLMVEKLKALEGQKCEKTDHEDGGCC